VKAGSWGPKTVEKIIRIQERALALRCRWSTSSTRGRAHHRAGARCSPAAARRGDLLNEVKMSAASPQVCVLFGPSAAGGAYIPAFCDVVIMRDGNASMYLGSPRMAEMVIGEKVTLEEMGGAKLHTGVSGAGTLLVKSDEEGIDVAKRWLSYFPSNWEEGPPVAPPAPPAAGPSSIRELIPADENRPWDMLELIGGLVDEGSFLEVHARWAKELIVGYARLDGRVVGIVANQPKSRAECCSWTLPTRPRASSGRATRSGSRCSSWPTCRAS
jgi:acetyl-CoA carboxylase carboxyltransferase component